jgi:hypothetical protein
MIKYAGTPTDGLPTRIAMNRLGPQKSATPPVRKSAEPNGHRDDLGQNRLTAKKLTEEKARARTVARSQAVPEKLSTATGQVAIDRWLERPNARV